MPTNETKVLEARFFRTASGRLPVREWLLTLSKEDRRIVGFDIHMAEIGWPVGMPTCRPIKGRPGLWEIRSRLASDRIARILFHIRDGRMILLHAFVKKTEKTPDGALRIAEARMRGTP